MDVEKLMQKYGEFFFGHVSVSEVNLNTVYIVFELFVWFLFYFALLLKREEIEMCVGNGNLLHLVVFDGCVSISSVVGQNNKSFQSSVSDV